MARTKKTETIILSLAEALALAEQSGVRFTDAEVALAKQRVEQDEPLNVLESLLDERVGPSSRAMRPYPGLTALQPAPTPEQAEEPAEKPAPSKVVDL